MVKNEPQAKRATKNPGSWAFLALKNHRSAAVRGGAPGAPPPESASALASVKVNSLSSLQTYMI